MGASSQKPTAARKGKKCKTKIYNISKLTESTAQVQPSTKAMPPLARKKTRSVTARINQVFGDDNEPLTEQDN